MWEWRIDGFVLKKQRKESLEKTVRDWKGTADSRVDIPVKTANFVGAEFRELTDIFPWGQILLRDVKNLRIERQAVSESLIFTVKRKPQCKQTSYSQ